jgi:signal transduction histidine kinase/ActR/RegA family two-component response regulator
LEKYEAINENRLKTIKTILLFLIPFLGIMTYLRYSQDSQSAQMKLDIALMLATTGSLLLIQYFPRIYDLLTRFMLFFSIAAFVATLHNLRGDTIILIWGITIVLISFLLRGRHEGWLWSLMTIAATLILTLGFSRNLIYLDSFAMLTFVGNAFLVALFASWYEYLSEMEIKRIQTEQSRLESLVRYRTRSLHEANAKAMEALKKAQDASEAKSTFLANVSHEIRTPLNAINGFITMMLKDETDPAKKKQLQTIHEASDILTQLISDILDLSKIESGNMELNFSDFDPKQLFFSVAELYQTRSNEKFIDLRIHFCKNGEPVEMVRSDPMRIRQVLNNLLSNAVKFTPPRGLITVSGCYRDGWLIFSVEDTGIGMTPADQERVFRPFQQAKHQRDGNIQGTGLGLTISREIAHKLRGKLELRSAPGVGSTFTFSVPAKKVSGRKKTTTAPRQKLPEKVNAKILIVEDIRANQMFITMVLDRYGIRYDIANDGVEAVEQYQKTSYDLILMDENMPRMNGLEATAKIREIEREKGLDPTPIIALTANAVAGDRERLIAAGMNEYISKPVNPDTLMQAIVLLLKRVE